MAAKRAFEVGDLVQLKSGGPVMTIDKVSDYGTDIWCAWFAGKKHERAHFSPQTLIPAPDEESED